jgi:hypothetical protein
VSVTKQQLRSLIDAAVAERLVAKADLVAKRDACATAITEVETAEKRMNDVEATIKSLQAAMKILFKDVP